MSSLDRELDGATMVFDLAAERKEMGEIEQGHHTARTLHKRGPLRLTLLTLAPGGMLTEHASAGPIAVQPLAGMVQFQVDGSVHDLGPGQLLTLGAGVRHSASSRDGATFLLTVAMPDTAVAMP
ncbi:MAG: hypothetical protein ABI910_09540 [Gemmatimonadota bacterium]